MFRVVCVLVLLMSAMVVPVGIAGPTDDPGVDYPLMTAVGSGDPEGECTLSRASDSPPAACTWQVYVHSGVSYWAHYDFHNAAVLGGSLTWEWIDAGGRVVVRERCSFGASTDATDWYAGDCTYASADSFYLGLQTFRLTVTKFPTHCAPDPCVAHASVFLS